MRLLKTKAPNEGFSLIEVAIALVVIGLIVGFSMKGKELIHTAKLNSVMDQVNTIKMTTQLFFDKYNALPGDLTQAREMIDPSLENGSGTGRLVSISDAKRFWSHLVASGLLSMELVNGFPISKLGGVYSVSSNIAGLDGTWLILSGGTSDNATFSGIISQEDAYMIDKKFDNGLPSSGDIRTFKSVSGNLTAIESRYELRNKATNCIIMFRVW